VLIKLLEYAALLCCLSLRGYLEIRISSGPYKVYEYGTDLYLTSNMYLVVSLHVILVMKQVVHCHYFFARLVITFPGIRASLHLDQKQILLHNRGGKYKSKGSPILEGQA